MKKALKTSPRLSKEENYSFLFVLIVVFIIILNVQTIRKELSLSFEDYNYNNCRMCTIYKAKRKDRGNSTPRDVILIAGQERLIGLGLFLRTLRSTGCRAKVVLFIDNFAATNYSKEYYDYIRDCGVEFVPIETDQKLVFTRFKFFKKYLEDNRNNYDRVIQMDLFDSVFQYDPFTEDWDNKHLYLQYDFKASLKRKKFSLRWLNTSYNIHEQFHSKRKKESVSLKKMLWKHSINNGGQLGGVDVIIKFDDVMRFSSNDVNDQGLINYLYYTGIFKEMTGITPVFFPNYNEVFMSLYYPLNVYNTTLPTDMLLGNISIGWGYYPAVLHQFDRRLNLVKNVVKSCPNESPRLPDYVRHKHFNTSGVFIEVFS